jgi:pilus assembly protein FimV
MRIDQRISATAVLAAAALALSPTAWALGLGDATVESFLNQPLQARIDLISQETDDIESVTARLASAADYELIGASREAVSVPIRFTIEDVDGDPYILATSNLPITNPVLRLIVEVNWASGRMLREYTLFLDPPTVPVSAPAPPRIDQRSRPAAAPAPAPPAPESGQTVDTPAETAVDAPAPPPTRVARGQEYGPVQNGETLWRIASDWQGRQGRGINQVMIAIQRENPDAFLNGNINLLKRGAILRMPAMEDIEEISSAAARREVTAQQEEFAAGRSQDTVTSPATPLLVEESRVPAEAPSMDETPFEPAPSEMVPEPAAEPEAEEAAAEPLEVEALVEEEARDQLELVPPSADDVLESAGEAGGIGAAEASEAGDEQLRESLARTEEELINQQQQNAYLEERIRELESRLQDVEESAVDDVDLASMEERLREQREAAPEVDEPWYARATIWVIGLIVLVAGLFGWWLSRRGRAVEYQSVSTEPSESLQDLRGEAEDVLRTLGEENPAELPEEDVAEEPAEEEAEATVVEFPAGEGDAEVLDEESSDPEIQLDLARAYISMGDKEAARIILDEVISNGNERQQEEARKMLDLLASP